MVTAALAAGTIAVAANRRPATTELAFFIRDSPFAF